MSQPSLLDYVMGKKPKKKRAPKPSKKKAAVDLQRLKTVKGVMEISDVHGFLWNLMAFQAQMGVIREVRKVME